MRKAGGAGQWGQVKAASSMTCLQEAMIAGKAVRDSQWRSWLLGAKAIKL